MRILLSLLLLVTFSFIANIAKAKKNTIVISDSTVCNYETEKGMLHGEYRSYYKNGKLKSEGSFLQNNRFGFWVFYTPNGEIHCIRDYKNNYSYEEKNSKNQSKKVVWNENNTWTRIQEKDILHKSRFYHMVREEQNAELFADEKLVENLISAFKSTHVPAYTDYRFVNKADHSIFDGAKIKGFRIKEDRILDKTTQTLQYRIIGIAPIIYSAPDREMKELCWIHYDELKVELAKIKLNNIENQFFCKNLLDIFEYRNFAILDDTREVQNPETTTILNGIKEIGAGSVLSIEQENSYITNNFAAN